MFHTNARKVREIESAEAFIREFMYETLNNPSEGSYGKSYDFDLYLPWMMDWVLNVPQPKEDMDFTPTHELEIMFMDASWSLCQQGLMRPGPRSTNGESPGGAYGKGFALTPKGRKWLERWAADNPGEAGDQEETQQKPEKG